MNQAWHRYSTGGAQGRGRGESRVVEHGRRKGIIIIKPWKNGEQGQARLYIQIKVHQNIMKMWQSRQEYVTLHDYV